MFFKKEDPFAHEFDISFPQLMMEPWRVEEMVEEESIVQRYRLFKAINLIRLVIVSIVLLYFLLFTPLNTVIISVLCFYLILLFSLMTLLKKEKKSINFYGFFIGVLDIFILGYFFLILGTKIEFGFLFFSVLLSSMLLPFFPLLIILFFAIIIIGSGWALVSTDSYQLYGSFSDQINYSYQTLKNSLDWDEVTSIVLGVLVLAIIVNRMSNWSFRNEVRAQFRYKQLNQVLTFNRSVIEHLKTGVLVLTRNAKVISINRRAIELLNIQTGNPVTELAHLSEDLEQRFNRWQQAQIETTVPYKHNRDSEDVSVSFSSFGKENGIVMMTLESTNESIRQAQEAKLASLGRLTAGIAHEIRNPLSAINSAAELIVERTEDPKVCKLSNIILGNVGKTNQIIADILSLFNDSKSASELLVITEVISKFREQFMLANKSEDFDIIIENNIKLDEGQDLCVLFDEGQLDQILWNLCQNALRYARQDNIDLVINLRCSLSPSKKNVYIEVIDNGQGIATDKQNKIFEPFFTGHHEGSGLGLYLVRELCGANNANIFYFFKEGACFRIVAQAFFQRKGKC